MRDVSITHDGEDAPTPRAVSFNVAPGEVVLLLGPSGSGKSTLTLALNGLIPHAVPARVTGAIEVGGVTASDTTVAELSTRVAMVFQDPDAQLVTGTLFDEVAFGPENLRMPVAEVRARAEAALRRVGLWDRRDENPDRLSGGGRQRLAIACALAMGSPLLVLDEPTANLDPAGIDEVYAALAELVADGGRGIVLVEHNLDAAISFVDRVVVLDQQGHLVFDGPAEEVLRTHVDELVRMGVWLPSAAIAALRLREAGWTLDPLPLTPAELRAGLEARGAAPRPSEDPVSSRLAPAASGASVIERSAQPPGDAVPPLIRVRALSVTRGRGRRRRELLHGVDLDVAAGSFVAVVGANGAGKTTLVQAIAGVVAPPRGRISVGGIDPGTASPRAVSSTIGFVFQNPEHQFIAHTVSDELAHGLRLARLPDAEIDERVGHMLERFGLAEKARSHPFLLSGGQKRRLSVGTALIAGAPVLALDEPTFGQDRARADELLGLLSALNADGTTIIVVTHDMQLVAEYASHTVVLADGRILASGATTDVLADDALLDRAGLRQPPLAAAFHGIPALRGALRLADLPGVLRA
nr:ABC transporter ATP-binding protein [Microbacterium rhizomatis]